MGDISSALGNLMLRPEDQAEIPLSAWQREAHPEAQVEAFLTQNALLFAEANSVWKDVQAAQAKVETATAKDAEETAQLRASNLSRQVRRKSSSTQNLLDDPRTFCNDAKYKGEQVYAEIRGQLQGDTLEERTKSFVTLSADYRTGKPKSIAQNKTNADNFGLRTGATIIARAELADAHTDASFLQAQAAEQLDEILDSGAAEPFLERIDGMLALAAQGYTEYPGLLETLAVHHTSTPPKNTSSLEKALVRTQKPVSAYAEEFLMTADGHEKEISAAIQMARFIFTIADRADPALSVIKDMVTQADDGWPIKLQSALSTYANSQNVTLRTELLNNLGTFLRKGRLPFQLRGSSSLQYGAQAGGLRVQKVKKGQAMRGNLIPATALKPIHIGSNPEQVMDITQEQERKTITRFAVLQGTGSQNNTFSVGEVVGIDEIYDLSNFKKYAETYRNDPGVEDALRSALEIIAEDPYNHRYTKQLTMRKYWLDRGSRGGPRRAKNLRRFSMQFLSHVQKGAAATKTRIIYDMVMHEDQPTVLIYGAFFKQELEEGGSGKLPPR